MSSLAEQYQRFREVGGIADLSDRVQLRLTGADRVRYLNGQVTANVARLVPGEARPACVTTAKGKLCGDVFLRAEEDALIIDADASLHDALPPRLERYIVADDVTLEDLTGQRRLLHIFGRAMELPGLAAKGTRATRYGQAGIDLCMGSDEFNDISEALSATAGVLDETLLETLRIEAGIPRWGRELNEDTLPPEAGLERTHIDYDKGCYIGQETISRLKSVGHVNRRLAGFSALDRAPLIAGLPLYAADDPSRAWGVLTSAAWSFALDRPVALGYLKRGSPTGELVARAADDSGAGRLVRLHELPLVS